MQLTCPQCKKVYETELDAPPMNERITPIKNMFPDAEPYQLEQHVLGLCSDECWDNYLGVKGYIYKEGKRFVLTPAGSKRRLFPS